MNRLLFSSLPTIALILSTAAAFANAGPRGNPAPCGAGGIVWERAAPNTQASWRISVTGAGGPADIIHEFDATGTTDNGGWVAFKVAPTYNGRESCDARNVAIPIDPANPPAGHPGGGPGGGVRPPQPPPGGVNPPPDPNPNPVPPSGYGNGAWSILDIESLTINGDTGLYEYEGIWRRLMMMIGNGAALNIPDIFGDTNGDGILGDGDVLYSFVDLYTYLQVPPITSLGQTFTIVNGQTAQLPGMWFSPTPIVLDPLLGPVPSGGIWFSGGVLQSFDDGPNGVAMSAHTLETKVPEPATWAMLIVGFGLIGGAVRRRRTAASA